MILLEDELGVSSALLASCEPFSSSLSAAAVLVLTLSVRVGAPWFGLRSLTSCWIFTSTLNSLFCECVQRLVSQSCESWKFHAVTGHRGDAVEFDGSDGVGRSFTNSE